MVDKFDVLVKATFGATIGGIVGYSLEMTLNYLYKIISTPFTNIFGPLSPDWATIDISVGFTLLLIAIGMPVGAIVAIRQVMGNMMRY